MSPHDAVLALSLKVVKHGKEAINRGSIVANPVHWGWEVYFTVTETWLLHKI